MQNKRSLYIYLPIAFAMVLVLGIVLGYYLVRVSFTVNHPLLKMSSGKSTVNELIQFIDQNYVDTINPEQLQKEAIDGMLLSLDPHSQFIPASEFHDANDPLMGNFDGIGVQFRIERDTVMVVNTVPGGPSEKLGILAGDRIVKVDDKNITNIKITNEQVMKKLKGPKGTKVKVGIFRRGLKKPLEFTITRAVIPTWSVDIAYAVNKQTGYIKLSKFSATTHDELIEAMKKLKSQGVSKLILDLRGNSGGYLNEAIAVADEFLPEGKMIVYTKGLHRPKQTATSTSEGEWDNLPVVILIDEGSASASEIVAGAIQDNDRGTIIGRRSFGKGLVQEQINLSNGSALRLTVARYYTPTGRCIQKPYTKGAEDYYMEYYHRYEDGELETADSIKLVDSLKYKTPKGKIVYGGGGIMPDIFVPIEKGEAYKFYNESMSKGLLYQFAFDYTDQNRSDLKKFKDVKSFETGFMISPAIFDQYLVYARKSGINPSPAAVASSSPKVREMLKAFIARNLFDDEGFYPIYLRTDKGFERAVGELGKN
ncbi:MAG: S41 family peptidase [Bacteroidales bacterium]|nr:S41 family peptidase [Bacteroidales bacterium]